MAPEATQAWTLCCPAHNLATTSDPESIFCVPSVLVGHWDVGNTLQLEPWALSGVLLYWGLVKLTQVLGCGVQRAGCWGIVCCYQDMLSLVVSEQTKVGFSKAA